MASSAKNIVIHCPNDAAHVKPRILCFARATSKGTVFIHCRDSLCKRVSGNSSWYGINFNGLGGYTIRKMPLKYHFENEAVPVAVIEG